MEEFKFAFETFLDNLVLKGEGESYVIEEERGVGSNKDYLAAVKNIVLFCDKYVHQNFNNNNSFLKIDIPEYLTKPFDIFTELNIEVTVINDPKLAKSATGTGSSIPFEFPRGVIYNWDNKNSDKPRYMGGPDIIEITVYSDSNILNKGLLSKTLIHELNHKIEEYNRAINVQNSEEAAKGVFQQTKAYHRLKEELPEEYEYIYYIIYYLFSETERNATVAGLYGELDSMNSIRKNYISDLKNTNTYKTYQYYKKNINTLKNISFEKTKDLWEFLTIFFSNSDNRVLSPPPKDIHVTPKKMHQAFIYKAYKLLENLYRKIVRTASYYYDMHEETNFSPFGRTIKHIEEELTPELKTKLEELLLNKLF